MRELARTGLSPADQKELLDSLSNAVETRARYFPADSPTYVNRVRRFLLHTFFPQMGPLLLSVDQMYPPERISRSQCWQIVRLELSLLDGTCRPADELRNVISEVIATMGRNAFPLTTPPRWLVECGIENGIPPLDPSALRTLGCGKSGLFGGDSEEYGH